MCGIIGVASNKPSVDKLLIGLLRQEYRGYDSAGLAIFDEKGQIQVFKSTGKVAELQNTIGLRTNNRSLNEFIFYNLSYKKKRITNLDIGAAQPSIKVGNLLNIEIFLKHIFFLANSLNLDISLMTREFD